MSAPRTLTFFGGAATATGSMILLEAAGARILLDAGLFEGDIAQAQVKNRELPLDPTKLDAVLLSQAALAYAGRVPQLVRHGFSGPVYGTPGTRDAAAVLLAEAAMELEADGGEPMYSLADVVAAQRLFVGQPYHRPLHLRRNLICEFSDAGHILGSASLALRTGEGGTHRIVYSGNVGRPGSSLWRDPDPIPGAVDTLIVGSALAHEGLPAFDLARSQLTRLLQDTVARRGQMLVPASSLGPVHEFIRTVQALYHAGVIPALPIYLDTPTPVSLPTLLRAHPETIHQGIAAYYEKDGAFDNSLLRQIRTPEERTALDQFEGPAIIIAPSDTGGSGRAAQHLARCLPDTRHTILFLAFLEEGTVGRQLQDGADEVSIQGAMVERRAAVESLPAYGGLADGEEMRAWIRRLGGPVKRAFVVHGDDLSVSVMMTILREEGIHDVIVPREGESFAF